KKTFYSKTFHFKMLAFMTAILILGMFAVGCTNNVDSSNGSPDEKVSEKDGKDNADSKEAKGETKKDGPVTLTCFWNMDAKASMSMKSYKEIACFKEAEKAAGVNIKWMHPPAGQATEQFNLMMGSQEFPDLVYWDWRTVSGGPVKAIEDGSILKLNDIIDDYAPNYKAVLEANPDWKKDAILDDGTLYMFPFIRGDENLRIPGGFQIRKDWLDELQLEIPKTIDDWYTVLTAFRKNDMNHNGNSNDELPFVSAGLGNIANLSKAWGITKGFYKSGDQVKYGPVQPEYKDFLKTMAKWYKEGLIDPDFAATDATSFDAKVTGSLAGAFYGMILGNMGRFTQSVRAKQPEFELAGAPFPIGDAGKSFGYLEPSVQSSGTAITTACKNADKAAEYLDYAYGEKGKMLFNFGIEGESYTMENGEPKYTEMVLNNPDLPVANSLIRYALSIAIGPFVQDVRYFDQVLIYPEQQQALKTWIEDSDDISLNMPPVTLTTEESQKSTNIMSEINTYVDEMTTKFIMGEESPDKFDSFVKQIKKMKGDEALKIRQDALDRYNAR
ncbi:MAG TPA: ABC transporter substrate-binding protein, partial [Clostridiales bacterium]|nr:ABC transporter substrate-binding protein [Clostridiales bacterium]